MTRDEVIRIAEEAGDDVEHTLPSDLDFLERFAELVAKREREECAHMAAVIGGIWGQQANGEMIADAIRTRGEQ